MSLEYKRLEKCNNQFFDFVQSIRNQTDARSYYKKLQKCYEDASKACPDGTLKRLIWIIVRAVEGQSGDPDEKDSFKTATMFDKIPTIIPMTVPSNDGVDNIYKEQCDENSIKKWSTEANKCLHEKVPSSEKCDASSIIAVLKGCVKTTRKLNCGFHKFSEFQLAVTIFNGLIKKIPSDYPQKNKDKTEGCLSQLDKKNLKDCLVSFFLYFVSHHHAHHTQESLEMQIRKVKLCYEVNLRNCPFNVIQNIMKVYGEIFRIKIPTMDPSSVVTKVTLPGSGYMWCETKIFSVTKPIPTTKEVTVPRTSNIYTQSMDTTTVKTDSREPRTSIATKTKSLPTTETVQKTPVSRTFTTGKGRTVPGVTAPTTVVTRTKTVPTTTAFERSPRTRTTHAEEFTTSTIQTTKVWVTKGTQNATFPSVTTNTGGINVTDKTYSDNRTPTTSRTFSEIFTDKTKWRTLPFHATTIYHFSIGIKTEKFIITPTTVAEDTRRPPIQVETVTLPTTRTFEFTYPRTEVHQSKTPTVVYTDAVTVPTLVDTTDIPKGRTVIVVIIPLPTIPPPEKKTKSTVVTDRISPTTEMKTSERTVHTSTNHFPATSKGFSETITPTTTKTTKIIVKPHTLAIKVRPPATISHVIRPTTMSVHDRKTKTAVQTKIVPVTKKIDVIFINGTTTEKEVVYPTDETEIGSVAFTTETERFTPSRKTRTEHATHSTTKKEVVTITISTKRKVKPTPTTQTEYRSPKSTAYTEKLTRTTTETAPGTLPDNEESVTFTIPTTATISKKPRSTYYTETKENTKTSTERHTVSKVTEDENLNGTTIRIVIIEIEPIIVATSKSVATVTETQTPEKEYTQTYTEEKTPSTTEVDHRTPSTIKKGHSRLTPTTRIITKEPPSRTYEMTKPQSTTETQVYNKSPQTYTITHQVNATKTVVFYPKTKLFKCFRHPTTSGTQKMSVNPKEETETLKGTTIILDVEEPKTKSDLKTEKPLTTVIERYSASEKKKVEGITPTTVEVELLTIPDKSLTKYLPITTEKNRETPKTKIMHEVITKTTVQDLQEPVKSKTIKYIIKPPRTSVFSFPPATARFTDGISPTVYHTRSIPVSKETHADKKTASTLKIVIIENEEIEKEKTESTAATMILENNLSRTVKEFTGNMPQVSTERHTVRNTVSKEASRRLPSTKIIYITLAKTYVAKVNPTSTRKVFIPAKTFSQRRTHKTATTKLMGGKPSVRTRTAKITRTTVATMSMPGKKIEIEDSKDMSTIKILILEAETAADTKSQPALITENIIEMPVERTYKSGRLPTTRSRETIIPLTQTQIMGRGIPRTKKILITVPERGRKQTINPTTFKDLKIPLTESKITALWIPVQKKIYTIPIVTQFLEMPVPITKKKIYRPTRHPITESRGFFTPKNAAIHSIQTEVDTMENTFITEIIQIFPKKRTTLKCIYPTKPYTVCYPAEKKNCSEEVMAKWISGLKKCISDKLEEKGKTLEDIEKESNLKELEKYAAECIKKMGDSKCRNKNFNIAEWVLEKDIEAVGEYAEHLKNHTGNDGSYQLKKCVTLINDKKMEKCFPGFYDVVSGLVLYQRPKVSLKLDSEPPTDCILKEMKHCNAATRQSLEKILKDVFNPCVKLTTDKEKGTCKQNSKKEDLVNDCEEEDMEKSKRKLKKCIQKFKKKDLKRNWTNIKGNLSPCLTDAFSLECDLKKPKQIIELLYFILQHSVSESIKCKKENLKDFPQCVDNLLENSEPIKEVADLKKERVLRPIVKCFADALKNCPSITIRLVITSAFILSKVEPIPAGNDLSNEASTTIRSFSISKTVTGFCEQISTVSMHLPHTKPGPTDECVNIAGSKGDSKPSFVLIKKCSKDKVNSWVSKMNSCVQDKAGEVESEDPNYLTLKGVNCILKTCVKKVEPLTCSLKDYEVLKSFMRKFLDLFKENALSPIHEKCLEEFKMDNIVRCTKNLHNIACNYEQKYIESNKKKALECVQSHVKNCPKDVLSESLDIFYDAFLLDPEKINQHKDQFPACDPEEENGGRYYYTESSDDDKYDCGPGGILIRDKREIVYHGHTHNSDQFTTPMDSVQPLESKWNFKTCTSSDYINYFKMLQNCAERRLLLEQHGRNDSCYSANIYSYWHSMVTCLIDREVSHLNCVIDKEEKLIDYLHQVSMILYKYQEYNTSCFSLDSCFSRNNLSLIKCSDSFNDLVLTVAVKHKNQSYIKYFQQLLNCFDSVWSECKTNTTVVALPVIFSPLKLKYSFSFKEVLTDEMCNTIQLQNSSTHSECELKSVGYSIVNYSKLKRAYEVCKYCMHKMTMHCSLHNATSFNHAVQYGITPFIDCLKHQNVQDECTRETFAVVKNACISNLYALALHIKEDAEQDAMESYWEFLRCIEKNVTKCPELSGYLPNIMHYLMDMKLTLNGL